ncbi:metallophosphoesterase family protein [Caminibacter mediatlanticus]|uniref:Nuclease SbcCD subunit D n=1 Tax=Caminibacter mediatlanticus TB-2 TaxID=391592 RepID=A0AAI9AGD1_9BACT|nr:exonuclease subunit SbcD [Caminibacter mediatlanticus]EDM23142.1 nuclease SbcCD, D subunit [Caminibacter mediatlanticus TB-2]
MKVLHTSDWHLGNKFFGYDRDDEFELVLDFIIKTIKKEKVDVLLIAGDIFDVYYPSQSALKVYYSFLMKVKPYLKHIFIIAGNHDSISTLSAPKDILNALDIKVISGDENVEDMIVNVGDVDFLLVPYLREILLREKYKNDNLIENITHFYKEIISKSNNKKILTGHLTALNSKKSGSEKDIYIGKIEGVSAEIFDGADYVGLGHLHRYQEIKKNVVYSGSILKMSFDENDDKKLVIIDTDDFSKKVVDIPIFRQIKTISGDKKTIKNELEKINLSKLKAFVELIFDETIDNTEVEELKKEFDNIEIIKYSYKKESKEINFEKTIKDISINAIFEEIFKDSINFEELKDEFMQILEGLEDEN